VTSLKERCNKMVGTFQVITTKLKTISRLLTNKMLFPDNSS
jgi:hypothetical protein